MSSQDITGSLGYLRCYNWLAFYHTDLYYKYRVAFRCGLTADSRLPTARVYGCGSLVELCGLTQIKLLPSTHLCWPDMMWTTGVGMALLATQEAPLPLASSSDCTGRILSWQSTDQTMPPVLVCWETQRRPVAEWSYITAFQFQMTVPEIIIAILHCLSYVRSVCTWFATHVRDVHSCTISADPWVTRYRKVDEAVIDTIDIV